MTSPRLALVLAFFLLGCGKKDRLTDVDIVVPTRDAGAKVDAKKPVADAKPPATANDTGSSVPPATTPDASDAGVTDASAGDVLASDVSTDTVPSDGGSAADAGPGGEATWSHTACDKKALMFPKIDKNNGVFPIGSCPPPDTLPRPCGNNSKLKVMKATAQTWETGYVHPPDYAIDDHIMTRWSSNTMATSWIQLEFAAEQSFKRIYLAWEIAHASDYDIVTSNDGTTWMPLKQVRGGNGHQDILDVDGKARFVRLNGIKRGNIGEGPYGYSLFDFTLCGERP